MTPRVSRAKRFTAAAIIALGMLCALAGARPALAAVATGETAFKNGDFMTAVREFQGPAYRGDAMAQYYMGVIYADGLVVGQSLEEGLAWFLCAQTGWLPPGLTRDAGRRRSRILSRISPDALEQAEMRAETLCGRPIVAKKRTYSVGEALPEDISPARGYLGTLLFFPGDTMVTGAVVTFHELGFILLRDVLVGIVGLFGDFLFGLLALMGWLIIARIVRFFGEPVWRMIIARDPLTPNTPKGGSAERQASEAERD